MNLAGQISDRTNAIRPSGIRRFFDLAAQKKNVVSLGVGEPDFITPWHIREAGIYTLQKGRTFYTDNRGLWDLRQAISAYQQRRFNLNYDPASQILVTTGGSEAIDLAMRGLLNPGDEVIMPTPSYVAYDPCITMAGGVPVIIEMSQAKQFKLLKEDLEKAITPRSKVLLLNFPSNPTGGVMTYQDWAPLVPVIKAHDLIVVVDEIYAELTYTGQRHVSPANFEAIKDQVIIINGFSKAYSMTGYRLGYIMADQVFIEAFLKIHQYVCMCASTISQFAGIEAANNGDKEAESMRDSFMMRRNYLVKTLNEIGLPTPQPAGAFYVFPDISASGLSSLQFCQKLLDEQNLALVPGDSFGAAGEGYVRISYAYSLEQLKVAMGRLSSFLSSIRPL